MTGNGDNGGNGGGGNTPPPTATTASAAVETLTGTDANSYTVQAMAGETADLTAAFAGTSTDPSKNLDPNTFFIFGSGSGSTGD